MSKSYASPPDMKSIIDPIKFEELKSDSTSNTMDMSNYFGYDETIKLVIGRFAPFHEGHANIFNVGLSVADRIFVFVLGRRNKNTPFSFDLRKKIIEESVASAKTMNIISGFDVETPGYLPSMIDYVNDLDKILQNRYKKIFKQDGSTQLITKAKKRKFIVGCGSDRKEDYNKQLARELDKGNKQYQCFHETNIISVERNFDFFDKNYFDSFSGTNIRNIIESSNDVKSIEPYMTFGFNNSKNKHLLFNMMLKEMQEFS